MNLPLQICVTDVAKPGGHSLRAAPQKAPAGGGPPSTAGRTVGVSWGGAIRPLGVSRAWEVSCRRAVRAQRPAASVGRQRTEEGRQVPALLPEAGPRRLPWAGPRWGRPLCVSGELGSPPRLLTKAPSPGLGPSPVPASQGVLWASASLAAGATSSLSRTPAPCCRLLPSKNRGTEVAARLRGRRTLARPAAGVPCPRPRCDRSWSRPAALWTAPYQSRGSRQDRAPSRGRPRCRHRRGVFHGAQVSRDPSLPGDNSQGSRRARATS